MANGLRRLLLFSLASLGCAGDDPTAAPPPPPPPPPCNLTLCDMPPTDCHVAVEVCTANACSYVLAAGRACDDSDPCTESDVCDAAGTCAGAAVTCDTPAAPECVDPNTSRVHHPQGSCGAGGCTYVSHDIACPGQCGSTTAGECPNPCMAVACDMPPTSCFEPIGVCSGGACTYTIDGTATGCDDSNLCTNPDACQPDGSCTGTQRVCDSPPGNICLTSDMLRSYFNLGQCDPGTGGCIYSFNDVPCANCINNCL